MPAASNGRRLPLFLKQGVDVFVRGKRNEVVDSFAHPDILNRQLQVVRDGDRNPAFGGAVELGEHDSGDTGNTGELACLCEPVLPNGGVQNEKDFVWSAFSGTSGNTPYLVELVHEVGAGVQPARGVDKDWIASAHASRLDGVEHDRRRIGAFLRANNIDVGALRP